MDRLMIFKDLNLDKKNTFNMYVLIMIFSGVLGFIYEEIFYLIDLGYLVKRGSSYGPWIPIYVFGGLFITLITYKYKNKPLIVFLLSLIITGVLEYSTGYFFYEFFNTRLWDYNNEILNFGNINGYICLRSVLLFGIAGVFLVKFSIPMFYRIIKKIDSKILFRICVILISIFIMDVLIYNIVN